MQVNSIEREVTMEREIISAFLPENQCLKFVLKLNKNDWNR